MNCRSQKVVILLITDKRLKIVALYLHEVIFDTNGITFFENGFEIE